MTQPSTILIVDDQELAQKTLELLLLDEGYDLHFASNGVEALAQAVKLVPDLILLDVMMPTMNGFEVCRKLRKHQVLAEVPVIMLTALTDRESRLEGISAGADDFLSKPFDSMELKTRVQSILRLNRYRKLLVERVRFRWVVDNADDGYVVIDGDDTVVYANPRARFYLDFPEEGFPKISMPFLRLVQHYYHCEPQEAWENWPQPSTGNAPRYLVRPETANARSFWLQVDMLNLPSGPDMAGTIRLRDVTAQMNTLRDMRSFNATVTHKLLTPLVHITGNLEMLAKYYHTEMEKPDIAELFDVAYKGGQRLKHEVDEIIQYTRDLPLIAQDTQAFRIANLNETIATLSADLNLEPVQLICQDFSEDAHTVLSERAVTLILAELLSNAKKFHPQQSPTVEVTTQCENEGELQLRISDDGVTLSPEQLAHAWTPYFQAEKHFTGEVTGMGLGLTMISTLVWGVGGKCRIYNREPAPGVVVELILPLA